MDSYLLGQLYDETVGFRRLSGTVWHYDIQPYERYYLIRVANALYYVSPLVRRIVDKPLHLFFDSLEIEFKDSTLEKRFWEYVENMPYSFDFYKLLEMYVRSLFLSGELFVPIIIHKNNFIEFGFIPAENVEKVVSDEANGLVCSSLVYMVPKVIESISYEGQERREARIARLSVFRNDLSLDGDVLYFAINNLPFMRGRSMIEIVIDYVYAYDEFIFDRLRRHKLANNFVWDITLHGAQKEQIQARINELLRNPVPNSGGFRVHNEKEVWTAVAPNLNSEDSLRDSQVILSHIASGVGMSKEEVGLQYRSEQEDELSARYTDYLINRVIKPVVRNIVLCIIYSLKKMRLVAKDRAIDFKLNYSRYYSEMVRHIAVSLNQAVNALKVARERGWVSDAQAREFVCSLLQTENKVIDDKRRISISEANSVVNLLLRMYEAKLITEEEMKEVVDRYLQDYELIGGYLELRSGSAPSRSKDRINLRVVGEDKVAL